MADYFLGTYGGGISKPFRYTEVKFIFNLKKESLSCAQIQKHMFKLRSKDSTADRSCPAQPLAFYNKAGKINRCFNWLQLFYSDLF